MASRPYWKGYLKLSLVSCAVALYPAAPKSERISLHWLNRETGNRLRQVMVDSDTAEPVERENRVRGFQAGKNEYIEIEENELDALEIESSHTIDIESFIPRNEIDPIYRESSYYLVPDSKAAEEAFAVIREAMANEGVAGLGRAVLARRERILELEPRGGGILATVLHYNYEVRDDRAYFDDIPDIKIPVEMLDLAKHIIRTKMGHFDISKFEDRYENALMDLIRAKQAGRPAEAAKPQQPANVINLMDALRRSVAAEKGGFKKPEPQAARAEPRKPAKRAVKKPDHVSGPVRHAAQSRTDPKRVERGGGGGEEGAPAASTHAKAGRKAASRR
ncbi:MAG: Ku protein [Rhodomicrobium sp.]